MVRFARAGLLSLAAAGLSAVTVANATTFVVDTVGLEHDVLPGDGICETVLGECSIPAAVAETNVLPGADRIEVPGIPGGGYSVAGLPITDDVEFVGTGTVATVIESPSGGRLFSVDDSELTVDNITSRDGEGFAWTDGPLTIRRSVIENHIANFHGGAIYSGNSAPIAIVDSTFRSNRAFSNGGAINCDGAISIRNSVFDDNSGFNVGGAIAADGNVEVLFSQFYNNRVLNTGGAIHADGRVDIVSSEFVGNRVGNVGGAVSASGPATISGSTFDGNRAGNAGGALEADASATVVNSTFVGNVGNGGAGAILADGPLNLSHVTITGSVALCFLNPDCSTILPGAAVRAGGAVTIGNSIIYGNQEADCDGTWHSNGYNLLEDRSTCTFYAMATDQFGVDPLLDSLADNGGPTRTVSLLAGSPAIDNAFDNCEPADQRMIPRPQGPTCDSGALELIACDYDGVVESGEQCDDGNAVDGDGCSSLCETELVSGKSLRMMARAGRADRNKLIINSKDSRIRMGWGNFSGQDPVIYGARLRVVSESGEFDDIYDLPAESWRYIGKAGRNRGYKYKSKTGPISLVQLKPGRQLKVKGKGAGLGHSLAGNPEVVYWIVELGSRTFCGEFGGTTKYKLDKSYSARSAPAPLGPPDL